MARELLHRRLTRTLLAELASGHYRAGEYFPSIRKVCKTWGVSLPTAVSSFRTLEQMGLLRARDRSGHLVRQGSRQRALIELRRFHSSPLPPPVSWRDRIWELQGMPPNDPARNLLLLCLETNPETWTGGILTDLTARASPFQIYCADAFTQEAQAFGYRTGYFMFTEDANLLAEQWTRIDFSQVAAVAVLHRGSRTQSTRWIVQQLENASFPSTLLYDNTQGAKIPVIHVDNVGMGYRGIHRLLRAGHRRILLLSPKLSHSNIKDRITGALFAMEHRDASYTLTHISIQTHPHRSPHWEELLSPETRPTAIFAVGDNLLRGLNRAINTLGLRIPEDLSILACARSPDQEGCPVPVDIMDLGIGPIIGKAGAQNLVALINRTQVPKLQLITPRYISHGSIAKAE